MTKNSLFRLTYPYYIFFLILSGCHLDPKQRNNTYYRQPPHHKTGTNKTKNPRFTWSGQLTVTNSSKYRQLLRMHYICDRGNLFNLGTANCKHWDHQAHAFIYFQKKDLPAEATLTIQPYGEGFATSRIYSGFRSIHMTGKAVHINKSEGFQARLGIGNTYSFYPVSNFIEVVVKSELNNPDDDGILSIGLYYGASTTESAKFGHAELINKTMDLTDSSGFINER